MWEEGLRGGSFVFKEAFTERGVLDKERRALRGEGWLCAKVPRKTNTWSSASEPPADWGVGLYSPSKSPSGSDGDATAKSFVLLPHPLALHINPIK